MNREIKFRAWDKECREMYYSTDHIKVLVSMDNKTYAMVGDFKETIGEIERGNTILMQYTGLKDKNGTDIYEGDIVENASKELKFQVVYEAPSFNRKWIDDTSKRYREHLTEPMAWNTYIICEVIGNIYENPELLERDGE